MNKLLGSLCVLLLLMACAEKKITPEVDVTIDYADMTYWYAFGENDKWADVFYVYPTVSTISFADNDSSWFADITPITTSMLRIIVR